MNLVSVIIPTFNRTDKVIEAINSVRYQTYTDMEIIVVDDGSTDDTLEKISINYDPRIRVISQKNSGVSSARNFGMANARGKYIAFLDSDDLWIPSKLKKQMDLMEGNKDLGIIICGVVRLNMNDNSTVVTCPSSVDRKHYISSMIYGRVWDVAFGTGSYLIKKAIIDQAGGFDVSLKNFEDWFIGILASHENECYF